MKTFPLPCTPDAFLATLRFSTEIDNVEKNQTAAKEAVYYSHARENTFELYERPAFVKEKTGYLGGVYLRGAVTETKSGCLVATEYGRVSDHLRNDIICLLLLLLSLGGTVLSGNLFATMLPILTLLCGGFLIADGIGCLMQMRRLQKKWAVVLSRITDGKEGV